MDDDCDDRELLIEDLEDGDWLLLDDGDWLEELWEELDDTLLLEDIDEELCDDLDERELGL